MVSVKAASNGSKAISSLSDVWVLVEDVPPNMRTTAFLMAFGVLIGKPIEVDQDSLAILGPARLWDRWVDQCLGANLTWTSIPLMINLYCKHPQLQQKY